MTFTEFQTPDLHLHSTFSDGTDTPTELLQKVRDAGIDIFSLTDHDTYDGCSEIQKNLRPGDPFFVAGVELSCKDKFGKYHILGYSCNLHKPSIQNAVENTHKIRMDKVQKRLDFVVEAGYPMTAEEREKILSFKNPGKPHIAAWMLQKGYVKEKAEAFRILSEYKGADLALSPEEAIDAILRSDGIPVLAHGILADGSKNLSEEEITERVKRLKAAGLVGLECYYSTYTLEQKRIMLSLADQYHLLVTAGSDYHGTNKTVLLGETNSPSFERMKRYYYMVKMLSETN